MRLHILGICGTFMAGLALLAREAGFTVSGSDANCYPPMSDVLAGAGIGIEEGYAAGHLDPPPDLILVGNALTRGNPCVEYMLERGLPYASGPEWLARELLGGRWVLACAGTHGKTTTASLLAWILESAQLDPGFLIGGLPRNFGASARRGGGAFFVVEADEYDSAFFDKRSKFVHYRPRTLVINNIEYDHADIFPDTDAIVTQFHHLIRTMPGGGRIICPGDDPLVSDALALGSWTPVEHLARPGDDPDGRLSAALRREDGTEFDLVAPDGAILGRVAWDLIGHHNVANALGAMAAAHHAGVGWEAACAALSEFAGVARRLEHLGEIDGVHLYDDFAHHPTAIATTLNGLRAAGPRGRILAVLEPRSNTMSRGVHNAVLARALEPADLAWCLATPDLPWSAERVLAPLGARARVRTTVDRIVREVVAEARPGDHVVVMSNGSFEGIHRQLLEGLAACSAGAAADEGDPR